MVRQAGGGPCLPDCSPRKEGAAGRGIQSPWSRQAVVTSGQAVKQDLGKAFGSWKPGWSLHPQGKGHLHRRKRLRLAEGAREEAGHHYRHPSAHLLTAPRRRAGDRTYKDKDLPSKRFHSKETGTEKVQNGSSWGWQALTCAGQKPLSYLAPGPAARPLRGGVPGPASWGLTTWLLGGGPPNCRKG